MEWKTCKISDLAVIISGGTPKTTIESFWNGNIPWLSVKDFSGDSKYVYTTEKTITDEGLKHSTANLLSAQDIVISARGTVGELAMLPFPMSLNQSCFGLRARCDADFLYYLLKVKVAEFKQRANGGVFGTIIRTTFDKVKCRIPDSLECQHRIASILSAYDSLIENNTKRIRLLEKMAENLYKEWFVRFRFPGYEKAEMENGLPKGWKKVRYSDCVDVMSGGTPKTDMVDYYNGSIPFFTPKDASSGFFSFATMTTISEKGLANCNSKFYSKGTIMITARGTVGKVNIIDVPMAMNQSCFALESKTICSNFYLFFSIRNATERIKKMANGGVFDTIIVKTFDYIPLVIPNHELLISFDQKISSIMNSISCLAKQNSLLARRRDLLLPRLMSGKLEVKP